MGEDGSRTSLDWTQTSSTTFTRCMDNGESFMQSVGSSGQGCPEKQNWHTTTAIKITTRRENFIDEVKTAWKALRFQYPCYSAILEDSCWTYTLADPDELRSWLEETFHVEHEQKTARQLFPFNGNQAREHFYTSSQTRRKLYFMHPIHMLTPLAW